MKESQRGTRCYLCGTTFHRTAEHKNKKVLLDGKERDVHAACFKTREKVMRELEG